MFDVHFERVYAGLRFGEFAAGEQPVEAMFVTEVHCVCVVCLVCAA